MTSLLKLSSKARAIIYERAEAIPPRAGKLGIVSVASR